MSSVQEEMRSVPSYVGARGGLASPTSVQSCNFCVTQPAEEARLLRIDAVVTGEVAESNYQFFRKWFHDYAAWNSKLQQHV